MGTTHGRSTRRFKEVLAPTVRRRKRPCCRCGQPIDYTLPADHADSFTVEHLKPLSLHPELAEVLENMDAAHRRCNSSGGNKEHAPGIGEPSQAW